MCLISLCKIGPEDWVQVLFLVYIIKLTQLPQTLGPMRVRGHGIDANFIKLVIFFYSIFWHLRCTHDLSLRFLKLYILSFLLA